MSSTGHRPPQNGNGNGDGRRPPRGVVDFTAREFREKFEEERPPKEFFTFKTGQTDGQPSARSVGALLRNSLASGEADAPSTRTIEVVPAGADLAHDISHGTDAVNFLLAHLNFPSTLRAFVDCLVGLAGQRSDWFEEYGIAVGRRARTGKPDCTDQAMERWVQRQKARLRLWQHEHNFELVRMRDGDFDRSTGKNKPTRWRVPLVSLAAEVVYRARAKAYWVLGPRHQARALREAARELLTESPDAPPVRAPLPRHLTDEELLNRALKTIDTQLGVIREVVRRSGGDARALLERRYPEWVEIVSRSGLPLAGGQGAAEDLGDDTFVTPSGAAEGDGATEVSPRQGEDGEPLESHAGGGDTNVAPSGAVLSFPRERFRGGDRNVAPSSGTSPPSEEAEMAITEAFILSDRGDSGQKCACQTGATGEDCACPSGGGDTIRTTTTGEGVTDFDERLAAIRRRIRRAMDALSRRYPEPTPRMKEQGCVEVVWGAVTKEASRTEEALNETMLACAQGHATEAELESCWRGYVRARMRGWRRGAPVPVRWAGKQEGRRKSDE